MIIFLTTIIPTADAPITVQPSEELELEFVVGTNESEESVGVLVLVCFWVLYVGVAVLE